MGLYNRRKLYAVGRRENKEVDLLTVVSTKEEALEYIARRLILDNNRMEHYKSWLELNDLKDTMDNVIKYTSSNDLYSPDLAMCLYEPDRKFLTKIIRMVRRYEPIGCSFDEEDEIKVYNEVSDMIAAENKSKTTKKRRKNG